MSISAAVIVPHPPLIVPEVGNGQEKQIQKTVDAFHEAAKAIAETAPETIILISPHATTYSDYMHVASGHEIQGNLKHFGSNEIIKASLDTEFVEKLCRLCDAIDFPAGILGSKDKGMDHATYVPLYFLNQYYTDYRLVLCSISGLSLREHYRFGMLLKEAAQKLGRKTAVIASGDLSHKLKDEGPYGYSEEGVMLDKQLTDIMKSCNFIDFLNIDDDLREGGAECGLGSFTVMAGILDQKDVEPKFLSYECPFGVGYAVCIYQVAGDDSGRAFLKDYDRELADQMHAIRQNEDEYVKLARMTLEHYIQTDRLMEQPADLSDKLLHEQAGVFVSIKKDGKLRGCIGTIEATQPSIALEIMYNAVSSGTRDTRFSPVTEDELSALVYSVDVLSSAKPVKDKKDLDPKRFGVIVTKGRKRGLLLPNLDGVNTVDEQIRIACQKAGIRSSDSYDLECFEVVRHK